jgi:hypothetical protein
MAEEKKLDSKEVLTRYKKALKTFIVALKEREKQIKEQIELYEAEIEKLENNKCE